MFTPQANGDSSTDDSRSHAVAISTDPLTSAGLGESVEITSRVAGSHTRVCTFEKIAGHAAHAGTLRSRAARGS